MFDSHAIELTCPHCARKVSQTIGQLKRDTHITCSSCGKGFQVEASQLRAGLKQANDALADLKRSLGSLGK